MVESTVNGRSSYERIEDRARLTEAALPHGMEHELQQAKLAALAEFAAGAGHEINNPLGSILIASERLLCDETDPERRRLLATIGGQALRIRDMIGDLMLFAQPPAPELVDLDLAAEARRVADRFAVTCGVRNIQLQVEAASAAAVRADSVQLAVVIGELLRNAIDAVCDGGWIAVTAAVEQNPGREWAVLTVADNGRGLSESEREHLFDPFFSGRQAGRGLGFGLCKVWRIVTQHGGEISVRSPEEAGTEFTIRWPAPAG